LRFYQDFDDRVAAESAWLVAHHTKIVVADIPPLAVAAAERAGIPSVALANFTWDWIYRGFPESECIANDTALLYTSRGRLIEYDVMVDEMPRMLRCRFIAPDDLLAGRWAAGVDAVLRQPPPPFTPMTNGAAVAAEFILDTGDC
jgi:hypothetical protein